MEHQAVEALATFLENVGMLVTMVVLLVGTLWIVSEIAERLP